MRNYKCTLPGLTIISTIENNNTHLECSDFSGIFRFCVSETVFCTSKLSSLTDISGYIMCSNISTECTIINVRRTGRDSSDLRQYIFPNLRAYINFTVTAVNIVGHGESISVVYEPCEHLRGKSDQSSSLVA